MKSQVEEALEAELFKRAQKDLRHVAVTMVHEGPGVIINEPLKTRYDKILHGYADRSSIRDSDEVTPASAAFNRTRYALANVKDLGPGTLVRAIGDLWREGGGTCVRKDISEEALVNQMMIGTPGRPKIEAAKLLSTTCGTLTPAGGRVAFHGAGAFAERLKEGHEYKPVGAKLAGIDLSELDLTGAILSRADMNGARLSRANLSGADLSGADLNDADLTGANLTGANLTGAELAGAVLAGASLSNVNLQGGFLSRAKLFDANLSRAFLSDVNLFDADLSRANVTQANLARANLTRANLAGAILAGANLSNVNLTGVNLSHADLSDTNLSRAILRRANLYSANLSHADLSDANLLAANLDRADLTGVISSGAEGFPGLDPWSRLEKVSP